jgi:hypothetical protein
MSIHNDLLNAFEQRNLGKFQEALEVFQADPNHIIKSKDKTIFELILETPDSASFIKLCIENGADFYMVNSAPDSHLPRSLDDSHDRHFYSLTSL